MGKFSSFGKKLKNIKSSQFFLIFECWNIGKKVKIKLYLFCVNFWKFTKVNFQILAKKSKPNGVDFFQFLKFWQGQFFKFWKKIRNIVYHKDWCEIPKNKSKPKTTQNWSRCRYFQQSLNFVLYFYWTRKLCRTNKRENLLASCVLLHINLQRKIAHTVMFFMSSENEQSY